LEHYFKFYSSNFLNICHRSGTSAESQPQSGLEKDLVDLAPGVSAKSGRLSGLLSGRLTGKFAISPDGAQPSVEGSSGQQKPEDGIFSRSTFLN
jgi:hypothetical protein